MKTNQNEIAIYQLDNDIQLEVRIENETVWLTQAQMADLLQTTVPNINIHLKNIFEEGELEKFRTIKDFLIVRFEGKREIKRNISFYNLDAIISVGYRIKSHAATLFRIWATQILKDYLLRCCVSHWRIVERFGQKMVCIFENGVGSEGIVTTSVEALKFFPVYSLIVTQIKKTKNHSPN